MKERASRGGAAGMVRLKRRYLFAGQRGGEEVDAVGAPAAARLLLVGGRAGGGIHAIGARGGSRAGGIGIREDEMRWKGVES